MFNRIVTMARTPVTGIVLAVVIQLPVGQVFEGSTITRESPQDPTPDPLPIEVGDEWRYFKGTEEPPADWKEIWFDDSGWPVGPSGFGIGDDDDATILFDMYGNYASVYIRRLFHLDDPTAMAGLRLEIDFDDGFVAYLNGVEVARSNVDGEPPPHDATAWPPHEPRTPEDFVIGPSGLAALLSGTNVLAIQGHNYQIDNGDFSLIPALPIPNLPPGEAMLNSPADGAQEAPLDVVLSVNVSDPEGENLDVAFYGREVRMSPGEPSFTIIALPDTQYYSESYPEIFETQAQWIMDNRDAMNIVYVAHLGDIVESWAEPWMYDNADAAMSLLEDEPTMPYGMAVGNHDGGPSETWLFNDYFGVARFRGRWWYGGHHGDDNDNHYDLVSVAGTDLIIIYLEYVYRPHHGVLNWADSLLQTYHDRRAIVVSHYIIHAGAPGSWGVQGEAIYEALKDNPNLFLMLCGHIGGEGRRTDIYHGNVVHTLLSDYQWWPNGGNGWLRIYEFWPASNEIHVKTYSPWLDQFETDGDSEFTLNCELRNQPFVHLETVADVASGTEASISWSGRAPNTTYEWYVQVSDGTTITGSAVWSFTAATRRCLPAIARPR
jgi:hypothetical protein